MRTRVSKRGVTVAAVAVLVPLLTGCATTGGDKGPGGKPEGAGEGRPASLYHRLGEKKAIVAVVEDAVSRIAADKRINKYFAETNLTHLRAQLVDQICEASGGPCKYKGPDMKLAHKDMGVTNAAFDALVEDLVAALDRYKVGQTEKDELLAVLGPMRKDIVEKP